MNISARITHQSSRHWVVCTVFVCLLSSAFGQRCFLVGRAQQLLHAAHPCTGGIVQYEKIAHSPIYTPKQQQQQKTPYYLQPDSMISQQLSVGNTSASTCAFLHPAKRVLILCQRLLRKNWTECSAGATRLKKQDELGLRHSSTCFTVKPKPQPSRLRHHCAYGCILNTLLCGASGHQVCLCRWKRIHIHGSWEIKN